MNIEKLNLVGGMPIHQLIVTNPVTSDHAKYSWCKAHIQLSIYSWYFALIDSVDI